MKLPIHKLSALVFLTFLTSTAFAAGGPGKKGKAGKKAAKSCYTCPESDDEMDAEGGGASCEEAARQWIQAKNKKACTDQGGTWSKMKKKKKKKGM